MLVILGTGSFINGHIQSLAFIAVNQVSKQIDKVLCHKSGELYRKKGVNER